MLVNLLNICSEDELAEDDDEDYTGNLSGLTEEQQAELKAKKERKAQLRSKIKGVAKMAKYFHNIREESEAGSSTFISLSSISPPHHLSLISSHLTQTPLYPQAYPYYTHLILNPILNRLFSPNFTQLWPLFIPNFNSTHPDPYSTTTSLQPLFYFSNALEGLGNL